MERTGNGSLIIVSGLTNEVMLRQCVDNTSESENDLPEWQAAKALARERLAVGAYGVAMRFDQVSPAEATDIANRYPLMNQKQRCEEANAVYPVEFFASLQVTDPAGLVERLRADYAGEVTAEEYALSLLEEYLGDPIGLTRSLLALKHYEAEQKPANLRASAIFEALEAIADENDDEQSLIAKVVCRRYAGIAPK